MNAIQESYSEDAYHIAVAIINRVDFLLSWNFRHIVRKKTKDIIKMIITINNLRQVEIITPAELNEIGTNVIYEKMIELNIL